MASEFSSIGSLEVLGLLAYVGSGLTLGFVNLMIAESFYIFKYGSMIKSNFLPSKYGCFTYAMHWTCAFLAYLAMGAAGYLAWAEAFRSEGVYTDAVPRGDLTPYTGILITGIVLYWLTFLFFLFLMASIMWARSLTAHFVLSVLGFVSWVVFSVVSAIQYPVILVLSGPAAIYFVYYIIFAWGLKLSNDQRDWEILPFVLNNAMSEMARKINEVQGQIPKKQNLSNHQRKNTLTHRHNVYWNNIGDGEDILKGDRIII